MQFLRFLRATMMASCPAVRTAEMIRVVVKVKELSQAGGINPLGHCPIEVRVVCRVLHLLTTEVMCWKDSLGRIPTHAS
jgi:hypothetical protein